MTTADAFSDSFNSSASPHVVHHEEEQREREFPHTGALCTVV